MNGNGVAPFAAWLRAAIDTRGATLRDIAAASGVSPSALSGLARGMGRPSFETCVRLSEYFGVRRERVLNLAGYYDLNVIDMQFTVTHGAPDEEWATLAREAPKRLGVSELQTVKKMLRGLLATAEPAEADDKDNQPPDGCVNRQQSTDYGKRHNRPERVAALVGASA